MKWNMEWNTEYGHAVVLCIRCQQVADTPILHRTDKETGVLPFADLLCTLKFIINNSYSVVDR